MTDLPSRLQGLWLPLITPFRDGELDVTSLRRLVRHYTAGPIDGLILGATSGEGMSLTLPELERLVMVVRDETVARGRSLPICLGLSGAITARLQGTLDETADWPVDGYLIASPFYVRPSQRGLLEHFTALADHAAWPLVLYNIPYRTAVNISNETLLALAMHPNIAGIKDCSADRTQSIDFLQRRPHGFRVLTGEDAQCFDALADGADGAILLSAHVETATFASVRTLLRQGDHDGAVEAWQRVSGLTRLLFTEPSPAPAKYWLWRTGLIDSAEVRLPMVDVSLELAAQIDQEIESRRSVGWVERSETHRTLAADDGFRFAQPILV